VVYIGVRLPFSASEARVWAQLCSKCSPPKYPNSV
jgi:hypothetical protein